MEKLTSLDEGMARSPGRGAEEGRKVLLWLQIQSTTPGSGIMFIKLLPHGMHSMNNDSYYY